MTNSLWVLPLVDEIIVLNEGRVTEQGTYKDLIHDDGDFAEFCATYLSEQMEDEDEAHDGRPSMFMRAQGNKSVGGSLFSSLVATPKREYRRLTKFSLLFALEVTTLVQAVMEISSK